MRKLAFVLLASTLAAGGLLTAARAADTSFAKIEHGRELVTAGDCAGCHTDTKGKPFAGGRPISTPFGVIDAPNITPDRQTGIGAWSDNQFYKAMHFGVAPDGKRLYPAFPYPYFTKLTRDDVMAIRAYLNTIPPVKNKVAGNHIDFPLNHRFFMRGWNLVFFHAGTFKPDPSKSDEWNRGAYLVEGAGHCGACHTPKNAFGADKNSQALLGGSFQHWFAPEIANNMRDGTGAWSVADIVNYLKTGRNKFSGAAGPMAEVVKDSTSKLPDADLHAMAVYIKSVNGGPLPTAAKSSTKIMAAGHAIFADSCSGCHQADGKGVPRMFPPLVHNANVQQHDPTTVIRVILDGAKTVATDKRPTNSAMPAYNWKLNDAQVAAVATYVRNAWGNSAPAVSAKQVRALRDELKTSVAGGS
jgi:mono/diheme cytochrome c family protein